MASLSELYSKLRRYRNLKSSLGTVISNLNNAINNLEPASDKISTDYLIDDNSADKRTVINVRNSLIQKKRFLSTTVSSSIDSKISSIKNAIRIEEARLESEEDSNDGYTSIW